MTATRLARGEATLGAVPTATNTHLWVMTDQKRLAGRGPETTQLYTGAQRSTGRIGLTQYRQDDF
jgi:hypothetical protein